MSVETWLSALNGYQTLGPQATRVVRFLAREPQLAAYASAREIAERAAVNTSTVVRTAQQFGYDGWPALRHDLRSHYVASMASGDAANRFSAPETESAVTRMLRQDAVNLRTLATPDTTEAIRAVAAAIGSSRRILVLGTGIAAAPAGLLSHLGAIMGQDIRLSSGAATVQAAQVAQLGEDDCLVAINVWRLPRTLRALAELAKERGAKVCVLTDLHASTLSAVADHVVVAPIEGVRSAPSLTAMVAVVQAVIAALAATPDAVKAVGRVEQVWLRLDLLDDED
ncbi:MurR/RpiR family transcriptional regulator [Streptomyces sp. NPDC088147]|uniref:MurR/RpiR family transcriptional regulator n=1 Tax=Streptomyces sp. NPDC088147 TaxID=3365830 RepID=UPI0038260083